MHMKGMRKKGWMFTMLAILVAVFVSGCATLDQNMAASLKEYVVPGKVMHVANMNNYCVLRDRTHHRHVAGERGAQHLELDQRERLPAGQV